MIGFLTNNWALKLAAVALAILLWAAVRQGTPKRTVFNGVPVQVDLRDPGWRLVGEPIPASVSVTVTGPTGELMALAANLPRFVLPVDRVTDSVESQVVPPQWLRIPQGLELRQMRIETIRPDTVVLRYERVGTRSLPVKVTTRGDLPEGLALALPIGTSPSEVEVRGPQRLLRQMDSVPLMPVDLSGIRSPTNVPTAVDTVALEGLRITPSSVNVNLRVMPADSQPGVDGEAVARRRGLRIR